MSFRRIQSRAVNHHVFLDNRLTNFVGEHVHFGDLIVERDALINGNLTVKKDIRARSFYATGNFYLDNYILVPAGTIVQYAAINAPDGWLICDGALLNKISYSDLFGVIGNLYGGAPTDLSFNLPDMRGRVGVGAIGFGLRPGLSERLMGASGGAETHALNANEIPAHTHTGNTIIAGEHIHIATDSGHVHEYADSYFAESDGNAPQNNVFGTSASVDSDNEYKYRTPVPTTSTGYANITVANNGAHTHGFTTDSTGGGLPHNNMQPFLVIRYLIKY
jgi:microcystin-dependent protein